MLVPPASTWPLTLIDLTLERGASFEIGVSAGERAFAYVLEGDAALGVDRQTAAAGDVAWAGPPADDGTLDVSAPDCAARLLFYASPAIDEPVAMGGPFVMNTQEELIEAFADLRAGRLTNSR